MAFTTRRPFLLPVQCPAQLLPTVTQRLHGRQQDIGTSIQQYLSVQRAGIDRHRKNACRTSRLYADGGILHHNGLIGLHASLTPSHT